MMVEHGLRFVIFVVYIFQPYFCQKIFSNSPVSLEILQIPSNILQRTKKESENYLSSRLSAERYASGSPNLATKSDVKSPRWEKFHSTNEAFLNRNDGGTSSRRMKKGWIPYSLERLKDFFKQLFGLSAKNHRKQEEFHHPSQSEKGGTSAHSESLPVSASGEDAMTDVGSRSRASSEEPLLHSPNQIPPAREDGIANTLREPEKSENLNDPDVWNENMYNMYDWLSSCWNSVRERLNIFRKPVDDSDESPYANPYEKPDNSHFPPSQLSSEDSSDPQSMNDNVSTAEITKEKRESIRTSLAETLHIPDARLDTTFMLTDWIFEVLRHNLNPNEVVDRVIKPFIKGRLMRKALEYASSKFSSRLIKRFSLKQKTIESVLINYKSWYHFMEDQHRHPQVVDVFISTIEACDELSSLLIDRNWMGYDAREISDKIRKDTHTLHLKPLMKRECLDPNPNSKSKAQPQISPNPEGKLKEPKLLT